MVKVEMCNNKLSVHSCRRPALFFRRLPSGQNSHQVTLCDISAKQHATIHCLIAFGTIVGECGKWFGRLTLKVSSFILVAAEWLALFPISFTLPAPILACQELTASFQIVLCYLSFVHVVLGGSLDR